jgi:uncharacterized protein (TIGR00369 family)
MIRPARTPSSIEAFRRERHPNCFVCQPHRPRGLGVRFDSLDDGAVVARVGCPREWEGYPGTVHGGVLASLIDGAMTNWLFARCVAAVTVGLRVQYRWPVVLGQRAIVRAELRSESHPRYALAATIRQEGVVRVTATGHFFEHQTTCSNARSSEDAHP